jgi:anhydro-N-acetylmuramic acid kinase
MNVVGLMSGTSGDGVSAALVEVGRGRPRVLATRTTPYPPALRRRVLELPRAGAAELCEMSVILGEAFAAAARPFARRAQLVGSHGQTVWHIPGRASLQIGEPAVIAAATGLPVVSDFRPADIAAGGQGAPLVPFADRMLFARRGRSVAVLNIGGIANVTWLGADGRVAAFDTGPGNCLMDAAARRFLGKPFDRDGARARRGRPDLALLAGWLRHPWFRTPPPRSTGRELFSDDWLERRGRTGADDLLATLARFTAFTLASHTLACGRPDDVLVGGGGWRNRFLIQLLEDRFGHPLRPTDDAGVPWDAREAAAFALLAWAHVKGIPANIATGGRPAVLGKYSAPSTEGSPG